LFYYFADRWKTPYLSLSDPSKAKRGCQGAREGQGEVARGQARLPVAEEGAGRGRQGPRDRQGEVARGAREGQGEVARGQARLPMAKEGTHTSP
jgi:hypothetical protein